MIARCRPASRLNKTILILIAYVTVYLTAIYHFKPKNAFRFVSEDFSVGEKYSLIYLNTLTPAFSDADGARVFASCGKCFVTNNRGFVPMDLYDAVLLHDERHVVEESRFSHPAKSYVLEASEECLSKKLVECKVEPTVSGMGGLVKYDLCKLCQILQANRVKI